MAELKKITSTSNPAIRQLAQLMKKPKLRDEQDLFIVEGIKMYQEAPRGRLIATYASESFYQKHRELLPADGGPLTLLSDRVFESVSDTRSPQGILCLVRQSHYTWRELLGEGTAVEGCVQENARGTVEGREQEVVRRAVKGRVQEAARGVVEGCAPEGTQGAVEGCAPEGARGAVKGCAEEMTREAVQGCAQESAHRQPLVMALENLQDPGNLGTIVRTAEGDGVTGILLSDTCVDLYNPKVIRSTMGSIYRMPFCYVTDFRGTLQLLKRSGVRWYAAHLKGTDAHDQQDYTGPTGFLIGNESRGLTDETAALADYYIRIPMCGRVESLNAAVASAILMYEANRQRRAVTPLFPPLS